MDCKALPSSTSAHALVNNPNAENLALTLKHMVGRSALIGLGLYAFGECKNLVRNAVARQ